MRVAALLVALIRIVAADPARSPHAPECKPSGGVLFEVDQRANRKAKLTTATTRLNENGTWRTEVVDVDGTLARTLVGCLKSAVVDTIRVSLRDAAWKTTRRKVTCRPDDRRSTQYRWKGRLLYTERACNVDALDDDSRHVLDLIAFHVRIPDDLESAGVPTGKHVECIDTPLALGCP